MNGKHTCRCSKESEISEIHTDVKWIKEALAGDNGLVTETKKNTQFRIESEAKEKQVKNLIGAGWVTTIVLFIISLFISFMRFPKV